MSAPPEVIVTLTAFNEERHIAPIIERVRSLGYQCIVVDDGSTDETAEISARSGAQVVRHCMNLGQGYAVLTSFKSALRSRCDVVVEMDADGQHDPDEIPALVDALVRTEADVVVGSRIRGSNYPTAPFFRKTFLPFFTGLVNRLTGYEMTDAMCGFRAFRHESLLRVSPLLDSMLEPQYIAAEMFLRFARAGLSVQEVPIALRKRASGHSYKGLVRYGFGVTKAILRTLIDSGYRGAPRPQNREGASQVSK